MSDEAKSKNSKSIFLFFRIAVVTGGIIWAASRIGQEQRWNSFVEYFRQMNIWVFAGALCIFTFSHAIVGLRWWLLLRTQSIFISLWAAVKLYFLGWFYNICMPGSVGGDLVRAWYVTKHTDKRFEAVLSVFVDRVVVVEGSLVILFTRFAGIEEPAAWAIALSQRAVWMITSLPGAAIHLMGAHLPKDFFVDYDKPAN